jgi:hypothetical protein
MGYNCNVHSGSSTSVLAHPYGLNTTYIITLRGFLSYGKNYTIVALLIFTIKLFEYIVIPPRTLYTAYTKEWCGFKRY